MKPVTAMLFSCGILSSPLAAQDFAETVKAILARTEAAKPLSIQGSDKNWFFLRKELVHLAQGDLAAAGLAGTESGDPLPVIAKYNDELKALGVELLLVPVPCKAAIYPDKLDATLDPKTVPAMGAFLAKLKAAGVETLDLESVFKAQRAKAPEKQLYCATDSHWSPAACEIVAKLVADKFKSRKEISGNSLADLIALPAETIEFHGDLLDEAQKASVPKEKLPLARAGEAVPPDGKAVRTIESDPNSAMLVIGDSHLQVFRRGGSMIATQGGFIDHLAVSLPAAVEEITMQAGGADGPRVEIARATSKNPGYWTKKKIVVWLFTAREFTQGRWRVIPAQVKK
jgi:alginate O-acetyltransferase complex protein AlgJ